MARRSRESFDEVAEKYDRARPGYPSALFDDLWVFAKLRAGATVLEIGPGTGKASVELASRGAHITALELGPRLADVARRNLSSFPDCRVLTGAFETTPVDGKFDLVFAATAWHWLDPELRYPKAASLLGAGGSLAIITTDHVFPQGFDPFFARMQEIYRAVGWDAEPWPPPVPEVPPDLLDVEACGLFDSFQSRRYLTEREYTAEQYVELLDTYSDHRGLEPEERAYVYEGVRSLIGYGRIRKACLNVLQVARIARR